MSEERYRLLFDRNLAAVCLSTLEGRLLDCNEAYARMLGYNSREEALMRRTCDPCWNRTDREAILRQLEKQASVSNVEVCARRHDGSVFWVLSNVSLIPGDAARPALIQGTFIDIARSKRAEAHSRHRNHELEVLLRATQQINSILDVPTIMRHLVLLALQLVFGEAGTWGLIVQDRIVFTEYIELGKLQSVQLAFDRKSGAAGRAAMTKVPYISNHPDRDPHVLRELYERFRFRNLVNVPIVSRAGRVFGCFELHNKQGGRPYDQSDVVKLQGLAASAAVAIENARTLAECERSEESLRQLSARLLRLQDEERRRIARELHDGTAQSLTAVVMNLSRLEKRIGALGSGLVADSLALTRQCLREIRTLSYLLHPPLLDEAGLASALRAYVRGISDRSQLQVRLELPPEWPRLPREAETALFRVIQEGLTNIHRHSGSRTATVRLVHAPAELIVEVSDQGCGMPAVGASGLGRAGAALGVGIPGMSERMAELGGRLEILSSPSGTRVRAILPFAR